MVERSVTIHLLIENSTLADMASQINQQTRKEKIDMIVMGVSGKSSLEKLLVGSTTTGILKTVELPVLIVPQDALLGRAIKTIVFTSDLKEVDTISAPQLYDFLDSLSGQLYVVNVERKAAAEKYSPEMEKAIASLHELLKKYNPTFHYITGNDIVEEVLAFAGQQHASLIVAVHQKHGFWSRMFHESITKKLAYNSTVPLLSLPVLE